MTRWPAGQQKAAGSMAAHPSNSAELFNAVTFSISRLEWNRALAPPPLAALQPSIYESATRAEEK